MWSTLFGGWDDLRSLPRFFWLLINFLSLNSKEQMCLKTKIRNSPKLKEWMPFQMRNLLLLDCKRSKQFKNTFQNINQRKSLKPPFGWKFKKWWTMFTSIKTQTKLISKFLKGYSRTIRSYSLRTLILMIIIRNFRKRLMMIMKSISLIFRIRSSQKGKQFLNHRLMFPY